MSAIRELRADFTAKVDGMRKGLSTVQDGLKNVATESGKTSKTMSQKMEAASKTMKNVGGGLTKYVTAPIMALGGIAFVAANDFDKAMRTIRGGTGATGDDLDALQTNFKNVFKNVPENAETVANAIADLNTRTGATGKPLEDLTNKFLDFARITDQDVSTAIASVTRLWGDWGIEGEKQGETMDYLWKVAQNTGIQIDVLSDRLTQYGAPLRQYGFTLEESAILMGKWEKEGVNMETVMAGMRQGLGKLAKAGKDPQEEFPKIQKAIQDASNAGEANAIAMETFGQRAGPDMAAAIREGRFEIGDLMETVQNSTETVGKAAEETQTLGEKFGTLKNKTMTAIEPLGRVLLDMADKALPPLLSGLEKATGWFEGMSDAGRFMAVAIAGGVAAVGPLIVVVGTLVGAMAPVVATITAAGGVTGALGVAFAALTGPVGLAIAAIAGIVVGGAALVAHFKQDAIPELDRFGDKVSDKTKEALGSFFEMSDGATQALTLMKIEGTEMTKEMAAELVGTYSKMNEDILAGMKKRHADEEAATESFFLNSSAMSDEREEEILRQMEIRNDTKERTQQHYEDRITEIIETAAAEKRELTETEYAQIDAIHKEMNESAVEYLTDNEKDQQIILERMTSYAGAMSARQAAEVTKNSAKQRDEVIADAETTFNDRVAWAIEQRDETGAISAEEADTIIKEAQKTYDESVKYAQDTHEEVVTEAKKQAGEHIDEVDWQTGEILSKWDVYKAGVVKRFKETNEESLADFKRWGTDFDTAWNTFDGKAKAWVKGYKENVKTRFKETNEDSLADFKRWGTDFDTAWNKFDGKAKAWVKGYKENVKTRFKETNEDSLADFKRWGTDFDTGWTKFNNRAKDSVDEWKSGVGKRFRDFFTDTKRDFGAFGDFVGSIFTGVANSMSRSLESGVNGVIKGVNWVLDKLGSSKKFGYWAAPRFGSSASYQSSGPMMGRQYAHGTQDHPGGLALVGDGVGANKGPELIQHPDGKQELSPDKPTLMNLARGARVWSATMTRKILGKVPAYAGGTLGAIHDWAAGKLKAGADIAGDIWNYATNPKKLVDLALKGLGINAPSGSSGPAEMLKAGWKQSTSAAVDYVKKQLNDLGGIMGGNGQGFPGLRKTSSYGMRMHPVLKKWILHAGDDWGGPRGTPIQSQAAGVVNQAGYHSIRGNYVRVKTGNMERIYQHNTRNAVRVGDTVRKGQIVGYVGSTGRSTGPHLHYEVLRNGRNINPAGYADGGVVRNKQLAWLAEGGWAESVISHDPAKRITQNAIWKKTGEELGFQGDAQTNIEMLKYLERIARGVESAKETTLVVGERVMGRAVSKHAKHEADSEAQRRQLFKPRGEL